MCDITRTEFESREQRESVVMLLFAGWSLKDAEARARKIRSTRLMPNLQCNEVELHRTRRKIE